jgi:hypothetical protein
VLQVLVQHHLFAKLSKCRFAEFEIEYLGHLISQHGVRADPSKFYAMVSWPFPCSIKALCGFLGLTGYYQKFIRNYGLIVAPLTSLLKKNSFVWSLEATQAFEALNWQPLAHQFFASQTFPNPLSSSVMQEAQGWARF